MNGARAHLVQPFALALLIAAVYLLTLLPGLGFTGDTAEFQYIGSVLGIPHQPGYPLYVLLNWAWVHIIPFGSLAWKANVLSAACAVATCLLLWHALRPHVGGIAAAIGVLCLAFSKQFWINSVVAEVYTLATLFLAVIVWALLRAARTKNASWIALALFTWGVSLGHHPLVAPSILGILIIAWQVEFPRRKIGTIATALVAGVVLGLGSYAYLFIRSADPSVAFKEFEVHSLSDLLFNVSGGKFHSNMASLSIAEILRARIPKLVEHTFNQLGPTLVLLGFAIRATPRHVRDLVALLVATNLIIYLLYDIGDIEVYLIPTALACSVMAAFGAKRALGSPKSPTRLRRAVLVCLVPAILLGANFGVANRRKPATTADVLRAALVDLPDQAVLWEPWWVGKQYTLYLLLGEDIRQGHETYLVAGEPEDVAAYLEGDQPLTSAIRGQTIPPRLPVYTFTKHSRERILNHGFNIAPDGQTTRP